MVNTRRKLTKSPRDRGIPPITSYLKEFEVGEKANIVLEPSSQKGRPHHRYHGRVGTVVGKRGKSFVLRIDLDHTSRELIVRPEHLRKIRE